MSAPTEMDRAQLFTIVNELMMLLKESADYHRDQAINTVMNEALRGLVAMRRRVQAVDNRYAVGVVGLSNVGKSTLLNALLGGEFAPRRNGPCTAAPIEFVYGDSLQLTAYYRQGLRRPRWSCNDVEAIHRHLFTLADDAGSEASQSIRKVVVEVPHSLLANGLTITDTPGFGAAQIGGADGSHELALKNYLRDEVSQVFWIVLAEQGIGKREKAFYHQFFADVCDDVVVTGCEDWNQVDRDRFRRRFADCFEQRMPVFHFVSGLAGLKARRMNDAAGVEAAGIADLEVRIRQLADPSGRTTTMVTGLLQLAEDLGFWLREFKNERQSPPLLWWRPDSWARWTSLTVANDLSRQLTNRLEERAVGFAEIDRLPSRRAD